MKDIFNNEKYIFEIKDDFDKYYQNLLKYPNLPLLNFEPLMNKIGSFSGVVEYYSKILGYNSEFVKSYQMDYGNLSLFDRARRCLTYRMGDCVDFAALLKLELQLPSIIIGTGLSKWNHHVICYCENDELFVADLTYLILGDIDCGWLVEGDDVSKIPLSNFLKYSATGKIAIWDDYRIKETIPIDGQLDLILKKYIEQQKPLYEQNQKSK